MIVIRILEFPQIMTLPIVLFNFHEPITTKAIDQMLIFSADQQQSSFKVNL
jgi:hypothetical protein